MVEIDGQDAGEVAFQLVATRPGKSRDVGQRRSRVELVQPLPDQPSPAIAVHPDEILERLCLLLELSGLKVELHGDGGNDTPIRCSKRERCLPSEVIGVPQPFKKVAHDSRLVSTLEP